jgi:hypothetical protein
MPRPALSWAICSDWARVESRPSLTRTTRRTLPLAASESWRSPCESAGGMLVPPPASSRWTLAMRSFRTAPTRARGWTSWVSLA